MEQIRKIGIIGTGMIANNTTDLSTDMDFRPWSSLKASNLLK